MSLQPCPANVKSTKLQLLSDNSASNINSDSEEKGLQEMTVCMMDSLHELDSCGHKFYIIMAASEVLSYGLNFKIFLGEFASRPLKTLCTIHMPHQTHTIFSSVSNPAACEFFLPYL